jgi:hypothetical protein
VYGFQPQQQQQQYCVTMHLDVLLEVLVLLSRAYYAVAQLSSAALF